MSTMLFFPKVGKIIAGGLDFKTFAESTLYTKPQLKVDVTFPTSNEGNVILDVSHSLKIRVEALFYDFSKEEAEEIVEVIGSNEIDIGSMEVPMHEHEAFSKFIMSKKKLNRRFNKNMQDMSALLQKKHYYQNSAYNMPKSEPQHASGEDLHHSSYGGHHSEYSRSPIPQMATSHDDRRSMVFMGQDEEKLEKAKTNLEKMVKKFESSLNESEDKLDMEQTIVYLEQNFPEDVVNSVTKHLQEFSSECVQFMSDS